MAKMMIPRHFGSGMENGQFFKDAATALFTGLIGYYAEHKSTNIVGDVAKTLSQPPDKIYKSVKATLEDLDGEERAFIINRLKDLEGMENRFFHSVKTEITNNLLFAEFPDIRKYATMPGESPLLAQLVDPRTDIFLNIPQHVAEDFAPMLRLMLGSFLVSAQLIEVNEAPRARRLLIIDEAAKLGNMDILENIRDRGRSIGLHLMMFYQTPGEIAKIWGREGMSSWRDGCSATVMGPVSARESAQDLSTMLGTRTVRVTTEGSSSQHQVMSPMGGSVGSSESEQLRDVPLISPTLISQLPRHASIITVPGFRPILGTKAIAFTRKDMKDRVRSTDDIAEELDVSENQRMLLDRLIQQQQANAGDDSTAGGDGDDENDGSRTPAGDNGAPPASSTKQSAAQAAPRQKPAKSSPGLAVASAGRRFISFVGRYLPLRVSGTAPAADLAGGPALDKQATPAQPAASEPTVIRLQDCYPSHPDRAQICAAYFNIPAEQLVFAWTPRHVPGWLRPAWDLWALYMVPRPNMPLNLRNVTHEIIPHPKDVKDGLWIVRMWDRINWYFSHPDGRYEVYDLKRRRRQWDGLEWRLHLLWCWIRNEPRGLPPGLQPSTDYPDHTTLRIRISPATRALETTNARYDPVANAVWLPHTDKGPAPSSADWETPDIGPVPPDPPPQLVFEHVAAAGFEIVDGLPVAGNITDMSDDPLEWPDSEEFLAFMSVRIPQNVFVEGILRHRKPLHEDDMLFFSRFPEVPRERAARSGTTIANSNVPLKNFASVLWIDRVGDEWRLFRQTALMTTGYPLGAARTWPIVGHTLEWLDKPIVERSIFDDVWA